ASVIGAQGEYYIDPYYHLKPKAGEVAYWTRDDRRKLQDAAFDCLTGDEPSENIRSHPLSLQPGTTLLGGELRTYRLAVAATSAYTAFFGGTVTNAMSAIANTVVRLNQLYERDFAIHMTLVAREDQIIYVPNSNDPYTNPNNPQATRDQNQQVLDNVIGNGEYDIGHVFHKR